MNSTEVSMHIPWNNIQKPGKGVYNVTECLSCYSALFNLIFAPLQLFCKFPSTGAKKYLYNSCSFRNFVRLKDNSNVLTFIKKITCKFL